MDPLIAEWFGTTLLLLLGNGVVSNVVLNETKGNDSGWLVITAGWGFSVYVAVLCTAEFSGAHLNPAVTLGLAVAGEFPWNDVAGYIIAQMVGGFTGAVLVYVCYRDHFFVTDDADKKLGAFCNAPAIRSYPRNIFCEVVATFVLVAAVLLAVDPTFDLPGANGTDSIKVGLGSLGAIRVGLVVFAIGMCLGGTTGYAINPARDLAPRFAHQVLPVPGKRDSDWAYAGIPALAPFLGGALAGAGYLLLK